MHSILNLFLPSLLLAPHNEEGACAGSLVVTRERELALHMRMQCPQYAHTPTPATSPDPCRILGVASTTNS